MSDDLERERFEKWAEDFYKASVGKLLERRPLNSDEYYDDGMEAAWQGWQAALASHGDQLATCDLLPRFLHKLNDHIGGAKCVNRAESALTHREAPAKFQPLTKDAVLQWPDFDNWWEADGRFYDPDTSDVPWYDKRQSLAEYAFLRAKQFIKQTAALQNAPNP